MPVQIAMKRLPLIALAAVLPVLVAVPAAAVTSTEKMETCKFGADDQKLTGAKRKAFIDRCMANRNDARGPAPKGTAAKPAMPPPPAAGTPAPAGGGKM